MAMVKWGFVVLVCDLLSANGTLFHEASRVYILPQDSQVFGYFGYSVLLRTGSVPELVVGAPTAPTTHKAHRDTTGNPGAIYRCSLDLADNPERISCNSFEFDTEGNTVNSNGFLKIHHYKDEMWLGAALADVGETSLVICAPRWCNQLSQTSSSHRLINGMCYVTSGNRTALLLPLSDMKKQAYRAMESMLMNYFAYGEAGFSAKVSTDKNWLLLGSPGIMQWTGGVAKYSISRMGEANFFRKKTITNTYFTDKLHEDSYFGYTVDTGVFEIGGETLGVGGAPRGGEGVGQVLLFALDEEAETTPLPIKYLLSGKQLGSYFGSVVLVVDIDADGRDDLLVGAPMYADKTGDRTTFDQGVVYVYLNRPKNSDLNFELVSTLTGSRDNGARFGSAIANLGDIDDADDAQYPEIAVGAPYEADGRGAVYIYKGTSEGINMKHVQKITSDLAGFGYAISKGLDVDNNGCNDVAIGASTSSRVLLYRCTRSIHVQAEIRLPDTIDLPENSTDFMAEFCIVAAKTKQKASTGTQIHIDMEVSISVDVGGGRATAIGDSEYTEHNVEPGLVYCKELNILIHANADLLRPITLTMSLSPAPGFPPKDRKFGPGVRLGEYSVLQTTVEVQITQDCGEDMICVPDLLLQVTPLSSPFVPGSGDRLGAEITILNRGEPAYDACIKVALPSTLLKVPSNCRLTDMVLTCKLPQPFPRRADIKWILEIDAPLRHRKHEVVIETAVYESCSKLNGTVHAKNQLTIDVTPEANITIVGRTQQNSSLTISRQIQSNYSFFDFGHYFEITNNGPSDLLDALVRFSISTEVSLLKGLDCPEAHNESGTVICVWDLPARRPKTIQLLYRLDFKEKERVLELGPLHVITSAFVDYSNTTVQVASTLTLEPASNPLWSIVVAVVLGLLLITVITLALHKVNFFGRSHRERLQRLKKDLARGTSEVSGSMNDMLMAENEADLSIEPLSREPSPLSNYYTVNFQ